MTDQLSRVFAALADPTRRDMVARLTEADHTVNDLAAPYDVSLQAVSKHLKVLEDAGLVSRSREAQRRPVHLEAEVFDLMTKWIERYRRQAEERFTRLDAVLARMQDDDTATTTRTPAGRNRIMTTTQTPDTTTRYPEAAIQADEQVPAIHIWRDFAATPAQLFRAHTDPELFAQWVGPERRRRRHRPLGRPRRRRWRYTAAAATARGVRDVVPRLLPHRARGPHRPDVHVGGHARRRRAGDDDLRGPRRRPHPAHAISLCDSFEGRDAWLRSGMEVGVNDGYAAIDRLLAEGSL